MWCTPWTRFLLTVFMCLPALHPAAQEEDTVKAAETARDTVPQGFVATMKEKGTGHIRNNMAKFKVDKLSIKQDDLLEKIKKNIDNAWNYMKNGIDTAGINDELEGIGRWYTIAGDGIFTNKGIAQTHRNLATATNIIRELLSRTTGRKVQVDRYHRTLMNYRNAIDSLSSDSTLFDFPSDSADLTQYMQKLMTVALEMRPADSVLKLAIPNVRSLQLHINQLMYMLETGLEQIDRYRVVLSRESFVRELPALWQSAKFTRPFKEIIGFSGAKNRLTLAFYIENNAGKIFFLLLLVAGSAFFLRSLKRKITKAGLLREDYTGQQVLRRPILSAIIIVLNLFQFMFVAPPFIFNCIFWIVSGICLTFIFRHFITRYWLFVWLVMLLLFVLACGNNLILQPSRIERWGMFLLSVSGVLLAAFALVKGRRRELREKSVIYFTGFMGVLELISIFANLYGWYNFSKTLLISGYCSVVIGILLLWTVRFIDEGLFLASEAYKGQEKKLFYINFERVGKRAPTFLYVLVVVGWLILFGRNFYMFRLITDPIRDFLFDEKTIGQYTFSIEDILVFFLIVTLSVIISRIVSFFASEQYTTQHTSSENKKAGLGSWLLLIRIAIIGMGLFLAFAAAGIPLDKITLILGALGVGIGFGLQTLVNNLVSGLIIAFEKPVNVGDIIEVAGQSGTIKSIGFRSSIIATWEGAVVVIPNGDLLNQHVVNWTQGNTLRRGDVIVGVAFGTDLEKARELLMHIVTTHEKILKMPPPAVLILGFKASAIDFQVFFWLGHTRDLGMVKSDVVAAIHLAFKEHGIEIPFPQQELHIHTESSEEGKKEKSSG